MKTDMGVHTLYCDACGSRDVCTDAVWYPNLDSCYEQGDDWFCNACGGECSVTDDRRRAAEARYNLRRQTRDGCTCGAEYEPGLPAEHVKHCPAHRSDGLAA